MKRIACFYLIILFFGGCVTPNGRVLAKKNREIYYKVRPGDKITDISKKYNIAISRILEVNKIANPHSLPVGKIILLPDLSYNKVKTPTPAKVLPKKNCAEFVKLRFPVEKGKIIKNFSREKNKPYDGIAIEADFQSKVFAAEQGKILFSGNDGTRFGLLAIVEHSNNVVTVYTHLDKVFVKEGQVINKGDVLGLVGKSGGLKKPMLHFQVRVDKKVQDPRKFIVL